MAEKSIHSLLQHGKYLECSICLEFYKKPKVLPCMHTFCLSCLDEHIKKSSVDGKKQQFHCPYCRELIKVPMNGPGGFTTNHMFINFQELLEAENTDRNNSPRSQNSKKQLQKRGWRKGSSTAHPGRPPR